MERQLTYDVAVVGGGSAGVAAAVGAAQAGAKVLIIERNPYMGGQATHSCVVAYCGFHARGQKPVQVVAGVGEQVLRRLRRLGDRAESKVSPVTGNASIFLNPEILKLALDEVVAEAGVDLLLHATLIGADVEDGRIASITCVDDEGLFTVEAKVFVDASGDANLAHLAGCETRWGDANGVTQQASLSVRIDGLPADAVSTPAAMMEAVKAAKAEGVEPLPKEKGFMIRVEGADFGYLTTPSTTIGGMDAKTLTEAEQYLRRQAHAYVRAFREHLPGFENARLVTTGPQLGQRESRRIVGENSLSMDDVLSCTRAPDSIARGGWSPEVHTDNTITYTYMDDNKWFDIPLGTLKPKGIQNLWCAGRIIACDSVAHASVRVMGTGFATGHAAGVAAALTGDGGAYHCDAIRAELLRQGALL